MYVAKKAPAKDLFVKSVRDELGASVKSVVFNEDSRVRINNDIAGLTEGKIKDYLTQGTGFVIVTGKHLNWFIFGFKFLFTF